MHERMAKIGCLLFIWLLLLNSRGAYSQDNFFWEMFLPAVTNKCRPDNLLFCNNQSICESRTGYWYDNSCHSEPEPACSISRLDLCQTWSTCSNAGGYWWDYSCHEGPVQWTCSLEQLDFCSNAQECASIGGYWYEVSCHEQQSPNYFQTAKLSGDWFLNTLPSDGNSITRLYAIDSNTIKENPYGSGRFSIEGIGQGGDSVIGGYIPAKNNYRLYVTNTEFDILYEFTFTSKTDVSGCYYEINKSDGTPGPCISMSGSKSRPYLRLYLKLMFLSQSPLLYIHLALTPYP